MSIRREQEGPRQEGPVQSAPVTIQGKIATDGANRFTKILTWDGISQEVLWDGTKHAVEITVGRSWELLCYYTGYNAEGFWNMTVSVIATGVPSAFRKQALGDRYEAKTVSEDRKDFNMGVMPSGPVTISRVKLWSSNYYTWGKPPEDEW